MNFDSKTPIFIKNLFDTTFKCVQLNLLLQLLAKLEIGISAFKDIYPQLKMTILDLKKMIFQDLIWISFTFEDRLREEWRLYSKFKLEKPILHEIQSNGYYFAWYISKYDIRTFGFVQFHFSFAFLEHIFLGMEN